MANCAIESQWLANASPQNERACRGAMGIVVPVGAHRPDPRPPRCLSARTRRPTFFPGVATGATRDLRASLEPFDKIEHGELASDVVDEGPGVRCDVEALDPRDPDGVRGENREDPRPPSRGEVHAIHVRGHLVPVPHHVGAQWELRCRFGKALGPKGLVWEMAEEAKELGRMYAQRLTETSTRRQARHASRGLS